MALVSFNPSPSRNGTPVIATIDSQYVAILASGDPYLDSTEKINQISVYYSHTYQSDGTYGGRQEKRIVGYKNEGYIRPVSWSSVAKDGTWVQEKILAINNDGAEHTYYDGTDYTSSNLILS